MHLLHWPQPSCNCLPRRQLTADRLPPCWASQNALPSASRTQHQLPANAQMLLLCSAATSSASLGPTILPTATSLNAQGTPSPVCAAAAWGRDPAFPNRNQPAPPRPQQLSSRPAATPSPQTAFASSSSNPQQPEQERSSSAYQRRTQRRSSADSFAMSDSYDEGMEAGPNNSTVARNPSTPFPSLSSMDQHIDTYSNEELLRPNTPSPSTSGRGGLSNSSSSGGSGGLSAYIASAFPDAAREQSRTARVNRSRRSSSSMPPSYNTGKGLPGSSMAGNSSIQAGIHPVLLCTCLSSPLLSFLLFFSSLIRCRSLRPRSPSDPACHPSDARAPTREFIRFCITTSVSSIPCEGI
ncbi:hypothetical protein DUNSADRAFT_7919 [Dunaliella salina]|uniref:Encoded protein n=1 Tax=Dunaliella salina TaxID=3046 RepID=A0ABQ7GKH2_DUNSA|nr:hypothetical protein DUNSADRAFT_7919 [Dunaliella salina]|eukprot:KAF5835069.1 hypothetical protein DUNSADRAFT_7919 [Dunaliella salina]